MNKLILRLLQTLKNMITDIGSTYFRDEVNNIIISNAFNKVSAEETLSIIKQLLTESCNKRDQTTEAKTIINDLVEAISEQK